MHQHSHFSSLTTFLFLLSFPLFSFLFVKAPPPAPRKSQVRLLVCGGGDLGDVAREGISTYVSKVKGSTYTDPIGISTYVPKVVRK